MDAEEIQRRFRRNRDFKIVVDYVYPPIPDRNSDWCAYIEGEEEEGNYGYGPTAAKAVADLMEYWDE